MAESFGARLRQQREGRQIALSAISIETKISVGRLEALERDDITHWPSGIFRRSFVRAYAQAIGLDPDAVLREFLEIYPERDEFANGEAMQTQTRLQHAVASAVRSLSRLRSQVQERMAVQPYLEPLVEDPIAPAAAVLTSHSGSEPVVDAEPFEPVTMEVARVEITDELPAAEPSEIELEEAPLFPELSGSDAAPNGEPVPYDMLAEEEVVPTITGKGAAEEEAVVDAIGAYAGRQDVQDVHDGHGVDDVDHSATVDFSALAAVCTELGRVAELAQLPRLLEIAAGILDANGLIVWLWDHQQNALTPALACGYPEDLLAKLRVRFDAANVTAAAYRAAQIRILTGGAPGDCGAVVVPLLTANGCAGVLAVELPAGAEQSDAVRALVTILAAQLATFFGVATLAEAVNA
jgi:transcriptional regulator with XRE-family HTH domain